jgi:Putative metal-binding motif
MLHVRPLLPLSWLVASLLAVGCQDQNFGVYNTPPGVSITTPSDGTAIAPGAVVELIGLAVDDQDLSDALSVSWTSSVDGVLGEGAPDASGQTYLAVSDLSAGTHAITLQAVDTSGAASSTSVTIEVEYGTGGEGSPTVVLTGPSDGSSYLEADTITFVGTVTDNEQTWDTLATTLVSDLGGTLWEGNPSSNGVVSAALSGLAEGQHLISLIAEDADGNVAQDDVTIEVLADGRPTATIDSPADGASVWTTDVITFRGTVADTETAAELLAVTWTSSLDGTISVAAPTSDGVSLATGSLSEGVHVIGLSVIDGDGQDGTDSIALTVVDPLNWDDDGDGWTENGGDCDDTDSTTYPDATEVCDDVDNDCDGSINETWWDSYEASDTSTTAYDLGEVDDGFLWAGDSLTISGLTLHASADEDWLTWDADDDWYDNVDINASASSFSSSGTYVMELYLWTGSSWSLEDSDSGYGRLAVSYAGDVFDTDEDDWAIRVYASSWPSGSCSSDYSLVIDG